MISDSIQHHRVIYSLPSLVICTFSGSEKLGLALSTIYLVIFFNSIATHYLSTCHVYYWSSTIVSRFRSISLCHMYGLWIFTYIHSSKAICTELYVRYVMYSFRKCLIIYRTILNNYLCYIEKWK